MGRKSRILFRVLLVIYLVAVGFLCLGSFDNLPSVNRSIFGIPTDKVVHFLMFLPYPLLCFLAFDSRTEKRWQSILFVLLTFVSGIALAFASEWAQGHLTTHRVSDPKDATADILAISLSCIIVYIVDRVKQKR